MAKCGCNLVIYQGDDWAAMIQINDCDGNPVDLTGYTAEAQFREGIADQTWHVAAKLLCALVPAAPGAVPNQISISLRSHQTTRLREPGYRWDLQLISPDGIITTILAGEVKMLYEVTREVPVEAEEAEETLWRDADERYLMRYRIPIKAIKEVR